MLRLVYKKLKLDQIGKDIILLFFIFLTFYIIYFQANSSLWRGHLEVDVYVFFQRVEHFLKQKTFSSLKGNEHIPGSLLFFFLPLIFLSSKFTYSSYLKAFFLVNFILLFIHLLLYRRKSKFFNSLIFLLIILSIGPILLFRFELVVSLLVLLSILFWKQKNYYLAGLFLGASMAIKFYPIVFLPYLLLLLIYRKKYKKTLLFFISFLIGVLLPTLIFFILGGNLKQLLYSLEYHSLKPISIESIPGTFITLTSLLINNKPPALFGGWGVWGIKPMTKISPFLINWFWFLPVLIFYLYLVVKKQFLRELNVGVFFCLILLFLVFSKNLHPQYIFWFISFFPLLKVKKPKDRIKYLILFFFILIIGILNQLVYPILYSSFIEDFYNNGEKIEIFYLHFLLNLYILFLFIVSFKEIFIKKSIE